MVDREARDKLAAALRAYMDEEITAFEFDEALFESIDDSKDETAELVRRLLWCCYDDCKDHKVVASREGWSYFNRVLLLLESDAEIEIVDGPRQWRMRQVVAAICLSACCLLAIMSGFGWHLLVMFVPFGLVSMAIAWRASREEKQSSRSGESVEFDPFPSFADLLSVRRQVFGFKKLPYPISIGKRKIRGNVSNAMMFLPMTTLWLLLSPVALFFQMFPSRSPSTVVMRHGT